MTHRDMEQIPTFAGRTLTGWRDFSRRDDCLDQMVPSDLRELVGALTDATTHSTSGAEDSWIDDSENACPCCGGSGHKDDAAPRLSDACFEVKTGYRISSWKSVPGVYYPGSRVPLAEALTARTVEDVRREAFEEAAQRYSANAGLGGEGSWDFSLAAYEAILTLAPVSKNPQHFDDMHVNAFADDMKAKLAEKRAEGRGGWEDKGRCPSGYLDKLLRDHVDKGDPVDVANFAMMIHQRGERIAVACGIRSALTTRTVEDVRREALEEAVGKCQYVKRGQLDIGQNMAALGADNCVKVLQALINTPAPSRETQPMTVNKYSDADVIHTEELRQAKAEAWAEGVNYALYPPVRPVDFSNNPYAAPDEGGGNA